MQRSRPAAKSVAAQNDDSHGPHRSLNADSPGMRQRAHLSRKTTEDLDCDVRAKLGTARTIFRWPRNIEPITIDKIAGRGDGAENIIGCHLLPTRLRTDSGEHHDFWICLSGLRCRFADEIRIKLGITLRALCLNIEHVRIAGRVRGHS